MVRVRQERIHLAMADLYRIQPLEDVLRRSLSFILALVDSEGWAPAESSDQKPAIDAFLALTDGDGVTFRVRAGSGRFAERSGGTDALPREIVKSARACFKSGLVHVDAGSTLVPLIAGDASIGLVYLGVAVHDRDDRDFLRGFAGHISVALQNSQLYEIATVDTLTGVFLRRFFDRWTIRELKSAFRGKKALAFVVFELTGLASGHDPNGRQEADRDLVEFSTALKESTRSSDFIGRFGRDEFAVLLPNGDESGSRAVTERVLRNFGSAVAVGISILVPPEEDIDIDFTQFPDYFPCLGRLLGREAEASLLDAKASGGDVIGPIRLVPCPDPQTLADLSLGEDGSSRSPLEIQDFNR